MILTTRTRTTVLGFAMGTLLLAAPGCSDSDPTAAPCQRSGTGTLAFRNESSSATLRTFVDGQYVAEVAPGESSQRDVPGGSHIVVWYFQGTHVPACDPATATVAPCGITVLSCGSEPAPCELSHTGLLVVSNGMDFFAYDVYVDGTHVGRLGPHQQADAWVSADALHDVEFRGTFPCYRRETVAACEQLLVGCP